MRRYALLLLLPGLGCHRANQPLETRDLGAGVEMYDVRFYSPSLARQETYRVVGQRSPSPGKLHVVYLLHGNGGSYRDWQEQAPLAKYAARGYLFILPEGRSGYWVNSSGTPGDRYEDYVTKDLIANAERGLPADRDRSIAGISMGGFGALVLAFRHPGLYGFAGALSPPVDVPKRAFTMRRPAQSISIRQIFGPYGSDERNQRDPFWLAQHTDPKRAPFLYLGYGREPLADPITRFGALLKKRGFVIDQQAQPGGHSWDQWNLHLDRMMADIAQKAVR